MELALGERSTISRWTSGGRGETALTPCWTTAGSRPAATRRQVSRSSGMSCSGNHRACPRTASRRPCQHRDLRLSILSRGRCRRRRRASAPRRSVKKRIGGTLVDPREHHLPGPSSQWSALREHVVVGVAAVHLRGRSRSAGAADPRARPARRRAARWADATGARSRRPLTAPARTPPPPAPMPPTSASEPGRAAAGPSRC